MLEYRIRINHKGTALQEVKLEKRNNNDGIWDLSSTDWESLYTGKNVDDCVDFLKEHLINDKRSEESIMQIISDLDIE